MQCSVNGVEWKRRRAMRISNGVVELTMLRGGGHFADFRMCGSPVNALWEAPWETIDPQNFNPALHSELYGAGPAGKLLSGYTGHAVALPYFGMPNDSEAEQGLGLHGEAASNEWSVVLSAADECSARMVTEVSLPVYQLRLKRNVSLGSDSSVISVREEVENLRNCDQDIQWVEHAAFGEPLFARGEASLYISANRGITWPLGYEGRELLSADCEFEGALAPGASGGQVDLGSPFTQDGTGFVASLLADPGRDHGYVAVLNRQLAMTAGYVFEWSRFPWVVLWEENCARPEPPWNRITRVRGVEFGTSPMPLGLAQARKTRRLFDTPVLTRIPAHSAITTEYQLFLSRVPQNWKAIEDVKWHSDSLTVCGRSGEIALPMSRATAQPGD